MVTEDRPHPYTHLDPIPFVRSVHANMIVAHTGDYNGCLNDVRHKTMNTVIIPHKLKSRIFVHELRWLI